MKIKARILIIAIASVFIIGCNNIRVSEPSSQEFIKVNGTDLQKADGSKFFIKGTNLGNWLNPEGYMFELQKTSSPRLINEMICQLVGPDYANEFWQIYKDNYITEEDIHFIKNTGSNTIRLPFHYKLFTNQDYMGLNDEKEGFKRIDDLISWCRKEGLYLILDMHDAPGGQTGDNIDDSYGYPWIFESKKSQELYAKIWGEIADRYKDEAVILGYELFNEPIAHYFDNKDDLNKKLPEIYKLGIEAIRKYDARHIILLGGSQWNSNFEPLENIDFNDDNIMFTCHRYGGESTKESIQNFIDFRDKTNKPMYMGEIGHNTNEWMTSFCEVMEENNIGWTFWPYKKMNGSCFVSIIPPANWGIIVKYSEGPRSDYGEIRENRPKQEETRKILSDFLEQCKFKNNVVQNSYIEALGLKP